MLFFNSLPTRKCSRFSLSLAGIVAVIIFFAIPLNPFQRLDASYTGFWTKEDLTRPASQLFNIPQEIMIPSAETDVKDPCFDVLPADGGANPLPIKNTKVLVTGGAGFIGSNLVDRLVELGYNIRIFDNLYSGFIRNVPLHQEKVEFILGDIMNSTQLEEAMSGVDFVFHLAAMSKVLPSLSDPEMARFCTESNALGSWNVLNATRSKKVQKVIYAGSSTYYGNKPIPHQEEMAPDLGTPYAASKFEGEMQMRTFDKIFNIPTIINRFFMVYGPRQPTTGAYAIVTGVFARQASLGQSLTIEGDGTHFRDFIHVSDIVNGLILSQQDKELRGAQAINLGTGSHFSVQDVADIVSDKQVHVAERSNDLVGTLADTCRMKRLLNYAPKKDFRQEMKYMVNETMNGNVFEQKWLTPALAVSVPHLLPIGSPLLPWSADHKTLKALIALFPTAKSAETVINTQDRLVSVVPFGNDRDIESQTLLLMNTVFSLVRHGGATAYIVAALNSEYLERCLELNMPCFDAEKSGLPKIVSEILSLEYRVHIVQLGTTYIKSVISAFNEVADVVAVQPSGDIVVSPNEKTRSVLNKWSKDSLFDPLAWKSNEELKIGFQVAQIVYPTQEAEDWRSNCAENSLITIHYDGDGTNRTASSDIMALKGKKLWQLSACTREKFCDRQQIVPLLWLQHPPDLKVSGSMC